MMSDLAPVVLFVYNRVDHTQQTVNALKNNLLASQTDLVIYSDGKKQDDVTDNVDIVRQYISTITDFKSVKIICRPINLGLSSSIIDGVGSVVREYGKVIVLEDDMLTSNNFLEFMNHALDYYSDVKTVAGINAYVPPIMHAQEECVFFTRAPSPWGWATWADRWALFEKNVDTILGNFSVKDMHAFDFDSTYPYIRTIVRNKQGKMNTWAVFWYASIFINKRLCASTPYALVNNIGNDGSGENCRKSTVHDIATFQDRSIIFSDNIVESKAIFNLYKKFYSESSPTLKSSVYMFLLRIYRRLIMTMSF